MRKYLAALLALVLFLGIGSKAHAISTPSLEWSAEAGRIDLYLKNLDGSVYGVQLELTLSGSYRDCTFTANNREAYNPGCKSLLQGGKTLVTIYLTDKNALNNGTTMALGSLDLGTAETVRRETVSDRADITLLDHSLKSSSAAISVRNDSSVNSATPPNRPSTSYPSRPSNTSGGTPSASSTPSAPNSTDTTENQPAAPTYPSQNIPSSAVSFSDVQPGIWFQEAVQFVQSRGMMNGTSPDTFSPYGTTTRAMIVTILHRLEGSPAAGAITFADVPAGQYFAAPVAWAAEKGIVTGYSDSVFNPDAPVTREQLAAILYRYAQYKNIDVSNKNDLAQFNDTEKVSPYAKDPLSWAVEAKLITGIDSSLDPAGSATRAQVATILMRLCTNVLES